MMRIEGSLGGLIREGGFSDSFSRRRFKGRVKRLAYMGDLLVLIEPLEG
jgi:hypothetical protein